jgi:formiminoglutamase
VTERSSGEAVAHLEDPLWPRASTWLAEGGSTDPGAPRLAVLGVPLSQASITPSGAHETPAAVRAALRRYSTYDAEAGVDLEEVRVTDLGDLDLAELDNEAAQRAVADAVGDMTDRPDLLVLVGGDNSITRPALHRLAGDRLVSAGLLTLDAHHDVRAFHAGPSNGTPVRGLIEDGLPGANVVQIGIGALTNSRAYRDWAVERGVTVVTADVARHEGSAPVSSDSSTTSPRAATASTSTSTSMSSTAPSRPAAPAPGRAASHPVSSPRPRTSPAAIPQSPRSTSSRSTPPPTCRPVRG